MLPLGAQWHIPWWTGLKPGASSRSGYGVWVFAFAQGRTGLELERILELDWRHGKKSGTSLRVVWSKTGLKTILKIREMLWGWDGKELESNWGQFPN